MSRGPTHFPGKKVLLHDEHVAFKKQCVLHVGTFCREAKIHSAGADLGSDGVRDCQCNQMEAWYQHQGCDLNTPTQHCHRLHGGPNDLADHRW